MNKNIDGIVLRQVQYKEKDCMVTILTKEGMVSFLARGILSPTSKNASSCLLYNYSTFSLNEKNNHCSLTQSQSIRTFKNLYENLDNISCVSLMSEVTLKFVDEGFASLFDYFLNILYKLEEGFDSATLLAIYLAQIIKYTGYELSYDSCVQCGSKKELVTIDYYNGGFLCKNCATTINNNNSVSYLKSFRYTFIISSRKIDHYVLSKEDSMRLISEYSHYLCDCFGEKEIKSLEMYFCSKK